MVANQRITYRGHVLDAVKVDRGWQAFVDDSEVGTLQPTARDAIHRGKSFVNRSEGAEKATDPFVVDPNAPDPEWVADLRRQIGGGRKSA